ncbi:putative global transcription activator SNF2L2 [Perkinsus chesapeaki]|uniref:Putative global transcription activator SNF2L2 n=1 Tax=Perkinsus chesapeaki TaxID=330153 RepID=A0A7J6M674_PERCH|nr:putative global transcription activator SNF2L2 [Perkinsus chesapeaki]
MATAAYIGLKAARRANASAGRVLAHDQHAKEQIRIISIFNKYDTNKSGQLGHDQLTQLLRDYNGNENPSSDEVDFILKVADTDNTSSIEKDEVLYALKVWNTYRHAKHRIEEYFDKYDFTRDGYLDRDELKLFLVDLNDGFEVTNDEVDWVFTRADVLGDGKIHQVEFLSAISAWYFSDQKPDNQLNHSRARRLPSGRVDPGDACRLWLQSKEKRHQRIPCWNEACRIVEEGLITKRDTASLVALRHWRRSLAVASVGHVLSSENRLSYLSSIPSRAPELRALFQRSGHDKTPRESRECIAEKAYTKLLVPNVVRAGNSLREHWRRQRAIAAQLAAECKEVCGLISKAREEWEQKQEAKRLKLLRENNYTEYVNMIKESKNKKLVELLEHTDNFLSELGNRVNGDEECQLLPHQLHGLRWLRSLKLNNLNGILADEMGLGKTIQVIALLASLMEDDKINNDTGRNLIVVPLSTLPNWKAEFKKWLPTAAVVVLRGDLTTRRQILRTLHKGSKESGVTYDVCLTTPEILIKETRTLSKVDWRYVIIDEGHKIKNHMSRFHIAVSSIRTQHRLLLTGTPLQNSLTELWALLKFLLPRVFTDAEKFTEWFSKPFEAHAGPSSDAAVASALTQEEQLLVLHKLHTMLQPFLLRRTKSQVFGDPSSIIKDEAHSETDKPLVLPKKTEHIVWVAMSAWQEAGMRQITDRATSYWKDQRQVSLKNICMQLRKMAQHPYLFQDEYELDEDLVRASGKFELLDRILPKLLHFNHKVLIFSQMTCLLDILEQFLEHRGLTWFRLDGGTSLEDRQSIMRQFNDPDNQETKIFILSTRAGGLGLNLQSADTVILYDSDWNPQMDLQAMDRAHRVGQKNEVAVLRFTGTCPIERLILQRATAKRNIDKKVIQGGHYVGEAVTDLSDDNCVRLKSLLELSEFEGQEGKATTWTELNTMLARTPQEQEWFEAYDLQLGVQASRLMALSEIPKWLTEAPQLQDAEQVVLDRASRRANCVVQNYAVDGLSDASWCSE